MNELTVTFSRNLSAAIRQAEAELKTLAAKLGTNRST